MQEKSAMNTVINQKLDEKKILKIAEELQINPEKVLNVIERTSDIISESAISKSLDAIMLEKMAYDFDKVELDLDEVIKRFRQESYNLTLNTMLEVQAHNLFFLCKRIQEEINYFPKKGNRSEEKS